MVQRYSEAVDAQQAIRRQLLSDSGVRGIQQRATELAAQEGFTVYEAGELISDVYARFLKSPPYWVAPEICDLLYTSAETLPEWTCTPDLWPTETGFVWFSKPYTYRVDTPIERYHDRPLDVTVHGFAWTDVETARRGAPDGEPRTKQLCIAFLTSSTWSRNHPEPSGLSILIYGGTLNQIEDHLEHGDHGATVSDLPSYILKLKIMASTLLFMRQKLLKVSTEKPDRATRRRFFQIHRVDAPDVRVIQLRRADYQKHSSDYGKRHVDWSWQWITRGHWRNQYYAATKAHRPIWIFPFWKGPQDAPFKPVPKEAFAVVR